MVCVAAVSSFAGEERALTPLPACHVRPARSAGSGRARGLSCRLIAGHACTRPGCDTACTRLHRLLTATPSACMFTLIAHRGGCADRPENTRAAFSASLEAGFSHIETDVQLTADGRCVIHHDVELDRTTSGRGLLSETRYADLKDLDAGSWFAPDLAGERLLTLEELLQSYRANAHIHLVHSTAPRAPATQHLLTPACAGARRGSPKLWLRW